MPLIPTSSIALNVWEFCSLDYIRSDFRSVCDETRSSASVGSGWVWPKIERRDCCYLRGGVIPGDTSPHDADICGQSDQAKKAWILE